MENDPILLAKVQAAREYLKAEFPDYDLTYRAMPGHHAYSLRIRGAETYELRITRELADNNTPEKLAALLRNWDVAQVIRKFSRVIFATGFLQPLAVKLTS